MPFYDRTNFYPDGSIGFLNRVCHQHAFALLDQAFADEDVSAVQWTALISIYFGRGETCAGLARHLAHDKGAMTRMVDVLEEKGLVDRTRNADDRRVVRLSLTPLGEKTALRCRDAAITMWNDILADWGEDEVHTLIAQMQKLRATLERFPACAD